MAYNTPIPPKELGCHRTGFEKNCRDLVVSGRCDRWRHEPLLVEGKPTTGFDCMDHWHVQFSRDVVHQCNGFGRAIESLRNELMALAGHPNGHPDATPIGAPFGAPAQLNGQAPDQKLLEG